MGRCQDAIRGFQVQSRLLRRKRGRGFSGFGVLSQLPVAPVFPFYWEGRPFKVSQPKKDALVFPVATGHLRYCVDLAESFRPESRAGPAWRGRNFGFSLWEALFVVSQKWSFPTTLISNDGQVVDASRPDIWPRKMMLTSKPKRPCGLKSWHRTIRLFDSSNICHGVFPVKRAAFAARL